MKSNAGPTLFPMHHCKTLHLVSQGIHNVERKKDPKAYLSPKLFDAHLTPLGVENLRKHIHSSGLANGIELVITSPLLRFLFCLLGQCKQLLEYLVGRAMWMGWMHFHCAAISCIDCPPFLAMELCREHLGVHIYDKRRSIQEYQPLFPAIDFSLIESDEDILWKADIRETNEEVVARGMKFSNWLWTREEKEIAVVTLAGFLFNILRSSGSDCHPVVKEEICKHFSNCELRSVVIMDRCMKGSDTATTNYPGKIPRGTDPHYEIVDEFQKEKEIPNSSA
ncbi:hypothetical protein NE237_023198 [Protea cynaroides]|uniref:Uncharacterized protein n=1 Tax=Protea cynaroides TaxID=273540 RepID=A0A9Q0K485_9MAGN|nr:hypothetical protein NE237_023198 [Protea cynaroides]